MKNIFYVKKFDSRIIFFGLFAALIACFITLLLSSPDDTSEKAMQEIADISNNIHENFKKKPDYWRLNTEYVINNGLSAESITKDDKLYSSLGNEILIGGNEEGAMAMPGSKSFNIVYKRLSRKNCVILSSYNLDYAEKIGLLSITIINSRESVTFSWGGDNELPISVSQAKNHCLGSENSIVWTFK